MTPAVARPPAPPPSPLTPQVPALPQADPEQMMMEFLGRQGAVQDNELPRAALRAAWAHVLTVDYAPCWQSRRGL